MEGEGERSALTIHGDDDQVRLEIVVDGPEAYAELRAKVVASDGRTVLEKTFEPAPILILGWPAKGMASGTYTLLLDGRGRAGGPREDVSRRDFTVRRER